MVSSTCCVFTVIFSVPFTVIFSWEVRYYLKIEKKKIAFMYGAICLRESFTRLKMQLLMCTQVPEIFKVFRIGFSIMLQKGPRPIVFCGPSGSGKSTLIKLLFDEFPDKFGFSVSHTTRQPRPGEEHGKHYYFTSKEDMQKQIDCGEFIETATFSGNLYGTSKRSVEEVQRAGKICVLDIEVEGVKQIKTSSLNPLFIFIKPPSIIELEKRLVGRKTETYDSLQRRLSSARAEIEFGESPGNFDLVIENDNIEKAYQKLKDFILTQTKQSKQNIN